MRDNIYFRMHLTENEHYFMESEFKKACAEYGCELAYYRKMKNGHIPMIRECKITGGKLGKFKGFLKQEKYDKHVVDRKCFSEHPDMMCEDCNCWKQVRAYCS